MVYSLPISILTSFSLFFSLFCSLRLSSLPPFPQMRVLQSAAITTIGTLFVFLQEYDSSAGMGSHTPVTRRITTMTFTTFVRQSINININISIHHTSLWGQVCEGNQTNGISIFPQCSKESLISNVFLDVFTPPIHLLPFPLLP